MVRAIILFLVLSCASASAAHRRLRHVQPREVAGCSLSLDASAITGLVDGAAVSTWPDGSGNARDATQGTSGNRPTFETAEIGGLPVVRFDGTDDRLVVGTSLFTYTGAATILAVTRIASAPASDFSAIISQNGGGSSLALAPQKFPVAGVNFSTDIYAPGGVASNVSTSTSTTYVVAAAWSDWSAHKTDSGTILQVNATGTFTAYGSNPSALGTSNLWIGAFINNGAAHLHGDLAAVIVFSSNLPAPLRRRLEQSLACRWRITLN